LALESDFLYTHPERLRYTRQFTDGRRLAAGKKEMNRLYVAESTPTITGTMADHRLPMSSGEVEGLAVWVAGELEMQLGLKRAELEFRAPGHEEWKAALMADLKEHRGTSIVIAGEWQPAKVHALAHALNQVLGNVGKTVFYSESAEANPVNQ